jgi:hypothetical protein
VIKGCLPTMEELQLLGRYKSQSIRKLGRIRQECSEFTAFTSGRRWYYLIIRHLELCRGPYYPFETH